MSVRVRSWGVAALVVVATTCLPVREGGGAGSTAIVLTGSDLTNVGGTLLDAMRGRVPNMRVERRRGECPLISFRGQRTLVASEDPSIYVDGTQAKDTCILDQVRVLDVDHVEVYTSGSTTLPGYLGNPNGLILVFLTG